MDICLCINRNISSEKSTKRLVTSCFLLRGNTICKTSCCYCKLVIIVQDIGNILPYGFQVYNQHYPCSTLLSLKEFSLFRGMIDLNKEEKGWGTGSVNYLISCFETNNQRLYQKQQSQVYNGNLKKKKQFATAQLQETWKRIIKINLIHCIKRVRI